MTETEQPFKSDAEPKAGIPALQLQVVPEPSERCVFQLAELLSYHDRAFVINTYLAIARRQPTKAELAQTLAELRLGHLSKTKLVTNLLASQSEVSVAGPPS